MSNLLMLGIGLRDIVFIVLPIVLGMGLLVYTAQRIWSSTDLNGDDKWLWMILILLTPLLGSIIFLSIYGWKPAS